MPHIVLPQQSALDQLLVQAVYSVVTAGLRVRGNVVRLVGDA
jgi:hypothetical protein